jgi:hypothetical protein
MQSIQLSSQIKHPCTHCGAVKFDAELIDVDYGKDGPEKYKNAKCLRTTRCKERLEALHSFGHIIDASLLDSEVVAND